METFSRQMPPIIPSTPKKSVAPLVLVIILLVIVIIGGLYYFKTRTNQTPYVPTTEESDNITESLMQQSQSDDLSSIEADLNATDIDSLDQGASVIEAGLQ